MPGKKPENLAGKLLLSTALIAISLAYGWWQRDNDAGPVMATMPMPKPPATNGPLPAPSAAPDIGVAAPARGTSGQATATPQTEAPAAPSRRNASLPPPPAAPLTALAMLRMYQPPPPQVPLPRITGTPAPGVTALLPAGTHLEDGDYLSDTEQYEWGDLQVKISVHGGQITGVQMVQYPDHRTESLQISQMASPILNSEVIKTQQSKVDVVSSATGTSYVFQNAIASAIKKAIRP